MANEDNIVLEHLHRQLADFANQQPGENFMTYLQYAGEIIQGYNSIGEAKNAAEAKALSDSTVAQITAYNLMYVDKL